MGEHQQDDKRFLPKLGYLIVRRASAGAGGKGDRILHLERDAGAGRQGQTVELVKICHCKAYKGIRENIKQAYAGIQHRRKKQAVRADKGIRAWSSWEHQQEQGEKKVAF